MKDKKHLAKVASLPCIACRKMGFYAPDVEIHHIGNGTMGRKASDRWSIPLCHVHHRTGGYGVAVHAGRKKWESIFGTEKELLQEVLNELGL